MTLLKNYPCILFDLDGTLSDPKEGITKSVQYALKKMNLHAPSLNDLIPFIGPPLQESFSTYYHLNNGETKQAIQYYRERFTEKGMFENKLYSNIETLLQSLKEQQKTLIVATSKPTVFAEKILSYFSIKQYFDSVVGSNLDGTRVAKTEIINYILNQYNYPKEDFVMIGDRKHDIIGATNNGIDSIGVLYGYGSYEEITTAAPTMIAHSVEEIQSQLLLT